MSNFKGKLQQAQALGMSAAQAAPQASGRSIEAKLTRVEAEEGRWAQRPTLQPKFAVPTSGTHNFPHKPKSAKPSQPIPWWQQFAHNFIATATNPRDNIARAVGIIPDAWRGFLLSPLQVRKQKKGSNLVISVNQKTLNVVNSVTGWIEKKFPWTGIKTVPANKLEFYESLAGQGLDIKPTGSLSPKKWTDRLLDIVLGRESKTLVKEAAEETAETAAKGGLRNTLKAVSPNLFDAVIEGAFNAYDYTLGEKKNETDKLQKWAVSSGVDLGGSLLTGALAVGVTALIVASPITITATGAILLTIGVGAVLDMALEATGVKDVIKTNLNNFIDSVQSLPAPTPAQPAVPIPTPPPAPQMYGTPTPPSSTPTAPSVEPQIAPAQTPSTPTPHTPES